VALSRTVVDELSSAACRHAIPASARGPGRGVDSALSRAPVRQAVAAGFDVHVHGTGWEQFIRPGLIRSLWLSNSELPRHYRAASVVLNDHGDDMRREGFLSNRLFDVAAVGDRLISDQVTGSDEIFGELLRTWHQPSTIAELLRTPVGQLFPPADHRAQIAARIAAEHSFDVRARRLLKVAIALQARCPR
jgi:O-antigen biosynthesis protein